MTVDTEPAEADSRTRFKRAARAFAAILIASAVATAGAAVGSRLAGPTESELSLGRVSFEVVPDPFAGVDAFVPVADWGVRADAFEAPFRLDVEVRSVNRKAAIDAASGGGATLQEVEDDLGGAAREAVIRAAIWALVTALAIAALIALSRPRSPAARRFAGMVAGAALVVVGGSVLAASASFDEDRFGSPAFYGRGQELAQLMAFFERQAGNDRYTGTFENALENFSAYLGDAPRPGEGRDVSVYIGSDLHNNLPVLSVLSGFVEDETFLLAGDFGHEGNESEARALGARLARLSDQAVAVSGNHDSLQLMTALAAEGVLVLERDGRLSGSGRAEPPPVVEAGGLSVAGFPDPLEWQSGDPGSPDRVFSFPELPDGTEKEAAAKEDLVRWFDALPRSPSVVLVHQNALAQQLAAALAADGYDKPLTIVTGHNHYQHLDRHSKWVTVVNPGTLGAGGPLRFGQEAAGLGQLHLDGESGALEAVDLIQIQPLSGQTQAERVALDIACPPPIDQEEPCHFEPSGVG